MNLRILVFFLIGLLIFVIDVGLNSDESSKDIYITDQELSSLLSAWTSQVGRDPTDEEVVNIINNLVQEEILYREALLLGLDQEKSAHPAQIFTRRAGGHYSQVHQRVQHPGSKVRNTHTNVRRV